MFGCFITLIMLYLLCYVLDTLQLQHLLVFCDREDKVDIYFTTFIYAITIGLCFNDYIKRFHYLHTCYAWLDCSEKWTSSIDWVNGLFGEMEMSGWMVYWLLNEINVDWLDSWQIYIPYGGKVRKRSYFRRDSAKRFTRTNLYHFLVWHREKKGVHIKIFKSFITLFRG